MFVWRFHARLEFGAFDFESRWYTVEAPDRAFAEWLVVEWVMATSRKEARAVQPAGSWPTRWRRPQNLTTLDLLEVHPVG